jgi:hypothetical protein
MTVPSIGEGNGVCSADTLTNGNLKESNSTKLLRNGVDVHHKNGHVSLPIKDPQPPEPIAIVGMALRLPGEIHTPEELWELLINKKTTRCPVPADRYNIDGFYSASKQVGGLNMRYGHFLAGRDGLDHFDASFFTMSKAEIEALDPQQRMLLEVVCECMENAGQKDWRGTNTGVFVGTWGDVSLAVISNDQENGIDAVKLGVARSKSKRHSTSWCVQYYWHRRFRHI